MKNKNHWEERYRQETIPWDIGQPSEQLEEFIKNIKPCSALDLGCGTGTEAIYLAKKGFGVSGLDISETAIQRAREKAEKGGVSIDFRIGDVLNLPFATNSFELINDRGCFHTIDPPDREKFVSEIYRVLKHRGKYLMTCFSDKEPESSEHKGPYRISKKEIEDSFSSYFGIKQIKPIKLYGKDIIHQGYVCLMEKK